MKCPPTNLPLHTGLKAGWMSKAWITHVVHPITLWHKARSSAGTGRWRTRYYWRIIICRVISKHVSKRLLITTIPNATMRVWITWPPRTSILAGDRRCSIADDALSIKHWLRDVGYTTSRRLHEHEPDELKVSLKSELSKSGILWRRTRHAH